MAPEGADAGAVPAPSTACGDEQLAAQPGAHRRARRRGRLHLRRARARLEHLRRAPPAALGRRRRAPTSSARSSTRCCRPTTARAATPARPTCCSSWPARSASTPSARAPVLDQRRVRRRRARGRTLLAGRPASTSVPAVVIDRQPPDPAASRPRSSSRRCARSHSKAPRLLTAAHCSFAASREPQARAGRLGAARRRTRLMARNIEIKAGCIDGIEALLPRARALADGDRRSASSRTTPSSPAPTVASSCATSATAAAS